MSNLEIIAVIINVVGVWLTVRRSVLCWPTGIVGVVLYAVIFYQYKLYSDALLQVFFLYLQVYGWVRWQQSTAGSQTRIVPEALPLRLAGISILAGITGGLILGALMAHFTDATLPWIDSQLTSFSLVASLWAARKYVASWVLWIIIDALYVGMYQHKSLSLTAGLYAGFVVLAAIGWYQWSRIRKFPPPYVARA